MSRPYALPNLLDTDRIVFDAHTPTTLIWFECFKRTSPLQTSHQKISNEEEEEEEEIERKEIMKNDRLSV